MPDTPSPPPEPHQPPPEPQNRQLKQLEQTVRELSRRVEAQVFSELLDQSVSSALSSRSEKDRETIQRTLSSAVADARAQADAAVRTVTDAHRLNLEDLRTLINALRDDVTKAASHARAVEDRVGESHLTRMVQDSTERTATKVFTEQFSSQLQELEDAYERADERFEQLRSYIDAFSPGGLPVVAQERDALRERVASLEEDLNKERADLRASRERLAQLDAARLKHMVDGELDPNRLEQRLRELDARSAKMVEREALDAENLTLKQKLTDLQRELDRLKDQESERVEAFAQHERLRRLEDERDRADAATEAARRELDRVKQSNNRIKAELREHAARLEQLKVDAAAADARETRLESLDALVEEQRIDLEIRSTELANVATELESTRTDAERLARELDTQRSLAVTEEIQWRAAYAKEQGEREKQRMKELEEFVEQRYAQQLRRLTACEEELAKLQRQEQDLKLSTAAAEHRAAVADDKVRHLEGEADREITRLRARVEADAEEIQRIARERADGLIAEAEERVNALEASRAKAEADLSELRQDAERLSAKVGALQAEEEILQHRIDALSPKSVDDEERVRSLEEPWFTPDQLPRSETAEEAAWLKDLSAGIASAGFVFHDRLLRAFHTSLKIADYAPLTVLAGISGTGKSELPRLYADLGGIPFMELAVQPSWDSPQDLFGFFNYTDGRVKAEPLARLLHQLGKDEDPLGEGPVIVLLDEMNLARVEYYFADLLSKLEARRSVSRLQDAASRQRASVLLDVGPGLRPKELFVDSRVMFVGTMNEDESTLSLSDKVIDRASLLTFPAPHKMALTEHGESRRRTTRLSWDAWQAWRRGPTAGDDQDRLNEINTHMASLERPFGHRVYRAIHAYLSNYPTSTASGSSSTPDDAWSDQWAMKIIPRLRGLECDTQKVRNGLDALQALIPEELEPAFRQAREREFFAWAGAADLYRSDA